jgi:adenylate kinase
MNDSGALVPDEIVVDMARSRMEHEDAKQGFILDGFPRTIAQAEALAVITKLDVVVNISFPEDLLVLKAVSRRVCSGCGRIYNLASFERDGISLKPLLPKRDGVCDACSSPLVSRDDDKESVVRDRLRHYHKATAPLVDYYATRGLLLPFDVKKGVDDTPVLLDALRSFLRDRGTLLA